MATESSRAPRAFRLPPAMPKLDFQTTGTGTVAVIAPTGELTSPAPPLLEDELERLSADSDLAHRRARPARLEFMDSSGLRLVVLADMRAREAGRRFALVRGDETCTACSRSRA